MTHHSRRVVLQPDKFIYFGKSFEAILEEHDIDPTDYNEAMNYNDVIIW